MKTLPFLTLLAAAVTLAACSKTVPPPAPVRSVKLLKVGAGAISHQQQYAADVRARVESNLSFRVGGKVVQRPAEVGQRVTVGQLLAQLDGTDLSLGSQAALAQVSAAQTQRQLAAADLQRSKDLKAQGFISQAEVDRRQAALDAADAGLRQARALSTVQGNQAGYARLLSDAAGVVVGVFAEEGQVVAAGAPVVRVARDGARDAVFNLPEDRLSSVSPGASAQVRLWSGVPSGQAAAGWVGTVREVAASADPLTRTYQVKVALPANAAVALGATAYVSLAGSDTTSTAIKLPTSALQRAAGTDNGTSVWVFDPASSTVQPRTVQLAGAQGNDMLVASGLQPGEEVVVAGTHVLSAGQKVTRFVSAPQAAN